MKGNDRKESHRLASYGIVWLGEAALFCFGLLAMLTLVVVMGVLTAVMMAATALPATVVCQKRDPRGRRDSPNTPEISVPRKAAAS